MACVVCVFSITYRHSTNSYSIDGILTMNIHKHWCWR